MDITWLGHAATRMRTRSAAVVMDPYDRSVGGTMGRSPGRAESASSPVSAT